jgi:hypothetical protein
MGQREAIQMVQGFVGALILALGTIALILKVEKAMRR